MDVPFYNVCNCSASACGENKLYWVHRKDRAKYFTPLNGPGVEVVRFFTNSGGGITLYISGEVQNLDNCPVTTRVHLKGDLAGHQNMVSAALMAFASGKKVGLHASGCEYIPFWGGSGGGQVPIINNLWVFE